MSLLRARGELRCARGFDPTRCPGLPRRECFRLLLWVTKTGAPVEPLPAHRACPLYLDDADPIRPSLVGRGGLRFRGVGRVSMLWIHGLSRVGDSHVMLFSSSILAAVVVYLMHLFLCHIRHSGGERNLARKTLVDERFLI